MILVSVNLHASGNFLYFSVYAYMQVSLASHAFKQLAIVSLAASHQRCQDENLAAGIVVDNHVDDLFLRIFHHELTCHVAVSLACPCEEQTHVVVDFGSGANSRTRILVGGLLLDADDW